MESGFISKLNLTIKTLKKRFLKAFLFSLSLLTTAGHGAARFAKQGTTVKQKNAKFAEVPAVNNSNSFFYLFYVIIIYL